VLSLLAPIDFTDVIYWSDYGFSPGIDLGFFTLRFYSLAYLIGVFFAYWHVSKMIMGPQSPMEQRHVEDLFFYCTLGVIIGGRIGYAAFYRPDLFTGFGGDGLVSWELIRLWDGGMSFHGGLLGVTLAMIWVSWRNNLQFLRVTDYISVGVPMGMLLGRLANFTNGELWGRTTDVPWGMIFPGAGDIPRHPSQLYQAGLEGLLMLVLMSLLFWKTGARLKKGLLTGIFVTGIASARFFNEFFRAPDEHLANRVIETGLSQGQWLTIPLILIGLGTIIYAMNQPDTKTLDRK
jgi:phosphatidylglycerol:prolipoprotein diacylglycerol transferase